jgi:hypothetical protein
MHHRIDDYFVTDEIRKRFERSCSRGRSTSRAMSRQGRENARRSRGIASQLTTRYKGAAPRSGIGEFVFVILPAHRAGFPARMEPDMIAPPCGRRPRPRRQTGKKRKRAHPTSRHSYLTVTWSYSSTLTFLYPFDSKQESKLLRCSVPEAMALPSAVR